MTKNVNNENKVNKINLITLGDSQVGKTSLIFRYIDNSFSTNYLSTIGIDSKFKNETLSNGEIVYVKISDTAGQERFKSIAKNFLLKADGVILVYDITNKQSFNNVINWINLAFEKNKNSIVNFLVGNKTDKQADRTVTKEEGENLAKEKKLFFLETSAKKDNNVQKLFYYILYKFLEYYKTNEYKEDKQVDLSKGNSEEISTKRNSENKCKC